MTEPDRLFAATVPVFLHYVRQAMHLAHQGTAAQFTHRLTPDGFSGAEHIAVALGFVRRTIEPLTGKAPDLASLPDTPDRTALQDHAKGLLAFLAGMERDDFAAGPNGLIRHEAGKARLEQSPWDFTMLYALPNFFFHLSLGYASLRAAGAQIGKADFDGFHEYPKGFSFVG